MSPRQRMFLRLRRGAVVALGALAALPTSGTSPPQGVPSAATRSGPYLFGANYPWVKYGLDFGDSGFGQFGLSTDCSEGFRPERHPGFPEVHGVIGCTRSGERAHGGDFSLRVDLAIAGADPARPESGEVTTDVHDIAHLAEEAALDLLGQTLSVWVYVPLGNRGEPQRPNFIQLFVKDNSQGAIGLYSQLSDANGNIPAAGGWFEVRLTVGFNPSGFDPRHVRLIGVKIGIGGGSAATIATSIFVDDLRGAHPEIAFGFEEPSRAAIDAAALTGAGVKALRWFVFADGRASPEFDADGFVTGLGGAQFERDFDTLLRLADEHGFFVVPVLFDFLLCGDPDEFNGVPLFGRAELIRNAAHRQSFLSNALDPLLDRYGAAPQILAWEVINEPEWCLSDLTLPPGIGRPQELPAGGAVTTAEMRAFVGGIAHFIHDHPATFRSLVTLGSASDRFLDLWFASGLGLGLDVCQFHFYDCAGCLDEGRELPAQSPCVLGEFAALQPPDGRSVREVYEDTFTGGGAAHRRDRLLLVL